MKKRQIINKIIEIVLTALVSAFIAFLQNIIISLKNININHTSPEVAGVYGAIIHYIRKLS